MANCLGCSVTPISGQRMRAYLWAPQGHTLYKIAGYLSGQNYRFENRVKDSCVVVDVEDVSRFVLGLHGLLGEAERSDTRLLLLNEGCEPGLSDFGQVTTVAGIAVRLKGEWVVNMVEQGRLRMVAQPVCQLADGAVFGHEFLLRGVDEDGSEMSPATIFESATDPRVLFNLDRAARIKAVETAASAGVEGAIFINFMPGSVYDPNVCLRTTVNAVLKNGIDPTRVVFEIVETQAVRDFMHLRGIVNFYRDAGFKVALDDFGSGYSNLESYLALDPDYLKLDKSLTQDAATDPRRRDLLQGLIDRARRQGIRVIAEGIETQEQVCVLTELGAQYGQGWHFGRPTALPAGKAAA